MTTARTRRIKPKSRPDRWMDAVNAAKTAAEAINEKVEAARGAVEELIEKHRAAAEEEIQALLDGLEGETEDERSTLEDAMSNLQGIQEEYNDWYANMNENLQNGATGEKLQAIEAMDFSFDMELSHDLTVEIAAEISCNVEEVIGVLEEAEGTDLPRGFGRD